jgi:hypothetical protein
MPEAKKVTETKKTTVSKATNSELVEKHNQMIQFVKNTIA